MLDQWDHWYPDCPPTGHFLRTAFSERWVRFHSLPESKRYPDDEDEYAEALRRHNQILGELARLGEKVILLNGYYSDTADAGVNYESGEVPWRTFAVDDPPFLHTGVRECEWQPGLFDLLVRQVANWKTANVLMVAHDCRWALHPYDDGMDVILDTKESRDRLKVKYSTWLSTHPEGL